MEIRYMNTKDDRMEISKIYEESWKFAYRGIIPQDYLNSIQEGQWAINLDNPNRKTLVCIDNGRIVGTSSFSESRFERFLGFGEIISIYLLPHYIGKGYGRNLLKSAIVELRKQGHENIFLWVLEENVRSRHFYEQFGFCQTNDFLNTNIGGKQLREVRYVYKSRKNPVL